MTENKFILSIDGGGVRGMITAIILQNLERDLNKPLYEVFDFYAGSSIGSWLVLAISGLKMPASDIVKLFDQDNIQEVFAKQFLGILSLFHGPKYTGSGKRKVLEKLFGNKKFIDIKKHTLITAYDVVSNKAVIYKSHGQHTDTAHNPTIVEVADASSAAPTYFPSVKTEDNPPRWLIDGGIAANNPTLCIISEALRDNIPLKNIRLLSLGTGITDHMLGNPEQQGKASQTWGQLGWLQHGIIDDLFTGNTTVVEYQAGQLLQNNYYRINSIIPPAQNRMDNIAPQNLRALKKIGESWYQQHQKKLLAWLSH